MALGMIDLWLSTSAYVPPAGTATAQQFLATPGAIRILIDLAVIAFAGGILSALSMLNASVGFGAIEVAGWRAFPAAQTAAADPYAKAHRAKGGRSNPG